MALTSPSSSSSTHEQPAQEPTAAGESTRAQSNPPQSSPPVSVLALDLQTVADVHGLEQEIAVLRASIRHLANGGEMTPHVKVLAELRHQIEALCRTLKAQQSLSGPDGDRRTAEMEEILEELGDQLGVER